MTSDFTDDQHRQNQGCLAGCGPDPDFTAVSAVEASAREIPAAEVSSAGETASAARHTAKLARIEISAAELAGIEAPAIKIANEHERFLNAM